MRLQVVKTTDKNYVGLVVDVPVDHFGELSLEQIQEIASGFQDGQFLPTYVYRKEPNVRLVSSNYSVELEQIDA